jgi:hypothetical protein
LDAAGKLALKLPKNLADTLSGLFEHLPLGDAMPDLRPTSPARGEPLSQAEQAIRMLSDPALIAGIWLYVDELERSHTVSQGISGATGAYWHAIMHRREGDFDNAKYWLRSAGKHPAMEAIKPNTPVSLVDEVRERWRENPMDLVELQRMEWAALFEWCAREAYPDAD